MVAWRGTSDFGDVLTDIAAGETWRCSGGGDGLGMGRVGGSAFKKIMKIFWLT